MKDGNLYLIELYNDHERFFKIGKSVHRYCRFYQLMKHGYKCRIVYMLIGIDFLTALYKECDLHSEFTSYTPKIKFGGYRECFSFVDLDKYKILTKDIVSKETIQNLDISWR